MKAWCEPPVAWDVARLSPSWSHVHMGVGPLHRSLDDQAMAAWNVAGLALLHDHACMGEEWCTIWAREQLSEWRALSGL